MHAEREDDAGAAVVEFVLVSVLVVTLFLVVFQVGVLLHTRNVLVSVAADAARYGANADVPLGRPVTARARDGIASAFSDGYAARARVTSVERGGIVEVRIQAPVPLVLLRYGPVDLTVEGHAYEEGR